MNVVLLSDFSPLSTHMLDYAAMLFKNQDVNFTILHIKMPYQKESCKGKCSLIFSQKLRTDQEFLQFKGYDEKDIQTKFIEGPYIESIRHVIHEEHINLILLGNSSKDINSTGLFFDKKTLEIITKVKCSVVLVPEQTRLELPKTALLPTDFSITSEYSIFNILNSLSFVKQTHLSLLPIGLSKTLGPNRKQAKKLISKAINSLEFKSVEEIDFSPKVSSINTFNLIMVMAKNLSIFQDLFSTSHNSLSRLETPVLFLHDSKTL
ncbi:universal stress protein [Psychroflexus sp. YR1-1]|uniref:Universal stress protein n=1 Tax=Psychroflexus aurantiacus TaxID=2709310 RepID=A0A6B3R2I8_9FLAO|nr:universal stress protein [Psychroflexus aurantiacus]NEV94876.1 universal stress protein [Psychroflexus aurantiacus]